jgi:hypothetical protein
MWFAAHLVYLHKKKSNLESDLIAEESVIIIKAENYSVAEKIAYEIGSKTNIDSQISYWDPEEATVTFEGVIRLVAVSNQDLGNEKRPNHCSEITYRIMKFGSVSSFDDFKRGVEVNAKFWNPT